MYLLTAIALNTGKTISIALTQMRVGKMKNINDQISVAFKNNIDMQENWMQYPLYECYKINKLSNSINNLRIDFLSNRLKEMRNAMMQSRFK